jgi:hypothetical protein
LFSHIVKNVSLKICSGNYDYRQNTIAREYRSLLPKRSDIRPPLLYGFFYCSQSDWINVSWSGSALVAVIAHPSALKENVQHEVYG